MKEMHVFDLLRQRLLQLLGSNFLLRVKRNWWALAIAPSFVRSFVVSTRSLSSLLENSLVPSLSPGSIPGQLDRLAVYLQGLRSECALAAIV